MDAVPEFTESAHLDVVPAESGSTACTNSYTGRISMPPPIGKDVYMLHGSGFAVGLSSEIHQISNGHAEEEEEELDFGAASPSGRSVYLKVDFTGTDISSPFGDLRFFGKAQSLVISNDSCLRCEVKGLHIAVDYIRAKIDATLAVIGILIVKLDASIRISTARMRIWMHCPIGLHNSQYIIRMTWIAWLISCSNSVSCARIYNPS